MASLLSSDVPATKSQPGTDRDDRVTHLPVSARAAYEHFQATRDPADLDSVLLAILADYAPHSPAAGLAELPGTTQLMADLGFDSLALAEVVFYVEDLFGIKITHAEIVQVHTLDDLRGFIRRKLAACPPR